MKSIVSLKFKKLPESDFVFFAEKVVQNMSSDAQFVSLKSSVDELKVRTIAFKTLTNDANAGGKLFTIQKNEKKAALDYQLTLLAKQVDLLADENEAVVVASGYEMKKTTAGRTIDEVDTPTGFKIDKVRKTGTLPLSWDKVLGAKRYDLERRLIGQELWEYAGFTAATSLVLTNLEKGKEYELRICSTASTNVRSDWSDAISAFVS